MNKVLGLTLVFICCAVALDKSSSGTVTLSLGESYYLKRTGKLPNCYFFSHQWTLSCKYLVSLSLVLFVLEQSLEAVFSSTDVDTTPPRRPQLRSYSSPLNSKKHHSINSSKSCTFLNTDSISREIAYVSIKLTISGAVVSI